ncbi:hypothetical protein [Mesorhizobium japonicum]|uniref:Msr6934 protein n=1 Tax=Mesorhizobium japonicum (strain LMG 29417 / CECT 9101 / MAFF 303099) TaxID=266835 RepID=Q987S5_RHILO|nr:hypothetical protein [Mesorhizobium japonicum]BAB53125.1 msr6934 [Mesorhizobium japonicum MAFF 303099]
MRASVDQEAVIDRVIERAIIPFRTELPMTVAGKSQKFLMHQAMVEELGWWRRRRRSRGSAKAAAPLRSRI